MSIAKMTVNYSRRTDYSRTLCALNIFNGILILKELQEMQDMQDL